MSDKEGDAPGEGSPSVVIPSREFRRCRRCAFLDRLDFFDITAQMTDAKAACRKCGHIAIEEPKFITKVEQALILSGFYEEYKTL